MVVEGRFRQARAWVLVLALAGAVGAFGVMATGAPAAHAAKKKHCKKTQVLKKGKCVAKPKPIPTPPDPLSDADGDAIPFKWEAPEPKSPPLTCSTTHLRACAPKKCKKGQVRKHGKCVKAHKSRRASASVTTGTTSVAPLGASPNHKDIFVEIDYASQALKDNMSCSELDAIVAAFANAPVSNPDGKSGINLHIDAGKKCASRSYDLGGSRIFDAGSCPNTSAILNAVDLPESRAGTFHIAGFASTCGSTGEGGAGQLHGTKMDVFTNGSDFAHVLMHELGHNLGLDHTSYAQPNRFSVMSTRLSASSSGNDPGVRVLDYQRIDLPALDENNLDESAGIGAPASYHDFYVLHYCAPGGYRSAWPGNGPIDWNCSSSGFPMDPPGIDLAPQVADINGDGQLTVLPATHDEWSTLDYASGGQVGSH
jgi:hypothetical protein